MFQILQKKIEEMRQNGIEDQRRNEEVCLLKEQNKELKRKLNIYERGEQSCSDNHTHN